MKTDNRTGGSIRRRMRWMVVDDNVDLLELAREILLMTSDCEVTCFHKSEQALCTFRMFPNFFDCVLTDLDMPAVNGIELCERIHALMPDLPVILSTGSTYISDGEARAHGFFSLLQKPYRLSDLQEVIRLAESCVRSKRQPELAA